MKQDILVSIETDENELAKITVTQVDGDNVLTYEDMARCLAGGIALLVKMVKEDGMEDYVVMKNIIDYLNSEFVSNTSFADAKRIEL